MRVLITGAAGQVGTALTQGAPDWAEVIALGSHQLDVSDEAVVSTTLSRLKPRLVINAAAYTAVDRAEAEERRAWEINGLAPGYLGAAAARIGAPVFHISTDYVFSGMANEPYVEIAQPGPLTAYGRGKLAGELQLARSCREHVILRTSWVFSAHGSNFVKTMLRLGRERTELRVVADQLGGPTPADSIASALWQIAQCWRKEEGSEFPWGTYHFSGSPISSWHGFASEIFSQAYARGILPTVPEVLAITTAEFPTPAQRPAYSVLDCTKLKDTFAIEQPDWRTGLSRVLDEIKGA